MFDVRRGLLGVVWSWHVFVVDDVVVVVVVLVFVAVVADYLILVCF